MCTWGFFIYADIRNIYIGKKSKLLKNRPHHLTPTPFAL
ncbi:hypothetical protein M23134_07478 [Microscilla marina ATCC 23134]|uniref:Uncharacterized protein n=1 Tax=Microscilla marina ATCC 23134 TaxID=313606 RepID=A1ZEW8_MICM2|nr:hypothetical protein M23134_07478 [Microscilla marina ATCC 23134]